MSSIDVSSLLSALSDAEPAGRNLEDDVAFTNLQAAAKHKPDQQFGETVIAGEEPDWRAVASGAGDLLGRTRDLRVGVILTRALIRTDGAEGLADGLSAIQRWLEGMWDAVHPQLDPADPDPTQRVNIVAGLDDFEATVRAVRDMPIAVSRTVGRVSYKDILVATNKLPAAPGKTDPPSFAAIEAAFQDAPTEQVQKTASDLERALGAIGAIEQAFTARVGAAKSVGLGQLGATVKGAHQAVGEQLAKKIGSASVSGAEGAAAGAPAAPPGEVRTRDDAIKALDRICDYFDRHEPSSPVPLLLRRAKRLINKSFMDLIRDMASNGVSQVEVLRGSEE